MGGGYFNHGGGFEMPTERMVIPALSLWQPWASAIATDDKQVETRGWSPNRHRLCPPRGGLLAIHASKRRITDPDELPSPDVLDPWLERNGYTMATLPRGGIVAIVEFNGARRMTDEMIPNVGERERAWGWWAYGRWAWNLTLRQRVEPAIPARGQRGLWLWEAPRGFELQ